MNQEYDVFISYSRKDYIQNDKIEPGNPVSAIIEMFENNGISYWLDKEGIYSGQQFLEVLSNAISRSKMLVFISSEHSNASVYTAGEIFEAHDSKKLIIPVRIDNAPYNEKFRLIVRPLDYIDYQGQPNTALPELLRAVNKEKDRLAAIALKGNAEAVKREIKEKAKEYLALVGQQEYIIRELYAKNKSIGNTAKRCPVCGKEVPLHSLFCDQCGWQFPKLYGIDGSDVPLYSEQQLALARQLWQRAGTVVDSESIDVEVIEPEMPEKELHPFIRNGKYGFADEDGKVVVPCTLRKAGQFSEGLAYIVDGFGNCGFIDNTGKIVIPCEWKGVYSFQNGVARVMDAYGRWYYIDKTGEIVEEA